MLVTEHYKGYDPFPIAAFVQSLFVDPESPVISDYLLKEKSVANFPSLHLLLNDPAHNPRAIPQSATLTPASVPAPWHPPASPALPSSSPQRSTPAPSPTTALSLKSNQASAPAVSPQST